MVNKEINFSLWLDFIERDYLKNEFSTLLEKGIVNGATSNPAIFANAITTSPAYKEQLASLEGKSAKEKYEALAIEDIKTAATMLRPLYDSSNDGYISIEVDPFLCNDTEGTIAEGKRLFKAIGEPNVMVKVPATQAGYEAMTELMSEGISVNATLVFSPKQATQCFKAMRKGIAKGEKYGACRVEGVISVFVSRFDRALDVELEEAGIDPAKTGIYNAAKIYNMIEANEVPNIRALFASTGVKGDALDANYYIKGLMAAHSVNTAPLATIEAHIETSDNAEALPIEQSLVNGYFMNLEDNGFDMDKIYKQLLDEGLVSFEESFKDMLEQIK
ncbi:MAG: Transaldolase (EC [uncultured Sulfurovum sp.]|uniref:Transaldolase n=1 Tax=uncultured Sulfurovum sp. TaxID=269237 RepID=A0A6S6S222_9BACT|nr:MAG: Transaldolase (EC [uncultured Sulfurovum sp.]